jgi:hypothetical protein
MCESEVSIWLPLALVAGVIATTWFIVWAGMRESNT